MGYDVLNGCGETTLGAERPVYEGALLDLVKNHEAKLLSYLKDNVVEIVGELTNESVDEVYKIVRREDPRAVLRIITDISKKRPTRPKPYAMLLEKLLSHPDWTDVFREEMEGLPGPILRLLYEGGFFKLKEIERLADEQKMAFADVLDGYYEFAEDVSGAKGILVSRDWIISGCIPGSISAIIKEDDIEKASKYFNFNNIHVEIPLPFLEKLFYDLKVSNWTPINAAAFYGSVRCFKSLLLRGAGVSESTVKMAFMGGNIQIIHFCLEKYPSFKTETCARIAADFFHSKIVTWLRETRDVESYNARNYETRLSLMNDNVFNVEAGVRRSSIDRMDLLMKLVLSGRSLKGYNFQYVLDGVEEKMQIPIAKEMIAHGMDIKELLFLGTSKRLIRFALDNISDVESVLKNRMDGAEFISKLDEECVGLIEERFVGSDNLYRHLNPMFSLSSSNDAFVERYIEGNAPNSESHWKVLFARRTGGSFECIQMDQSVTFDLVSLMRNKSVSSEEVFERLPRGARFRLFNCNSPSTVSKLRDRIAECESDNFHVIAALSRYFTLSPKQISKARKYDTWPIVSNIADRAESDENSESSASKAMSQTRYNKTFLTS